MVSACSRGRTPAWCPFEFAEPLCVERLKGVGAIRLTQGSIDEQTKVVVAPRDRQSQRFARKQAVEQHEILPRGLVHEAQHDGAVAEDPVHLAIAQLLECRR